MTANRVCIVAVAVLGTTTPWSFAQTADEPPGQPVVWRLADEASPSGTLVFAILDADGRAIPGRLTFVDAEGKPAEVFKETQAAPNELAVRESAFYTLGGRGAVTVPPGTYTVYASRGLEWSIDRQQVVVEADKQTDHTWRLRHEVDTTGWISGDFHLHTLTHSGHGDSNMNERIISLIGEGVEFAVATDHNHHTDYEPTIRELNAHERITSVTGNEVSVPVGHFNAFPLDPDRPVPDPEATDANALFKIIRAETNKYGITPVIQLNHPRWGSIDYFGKAGLDPVTGEATEATFSHDFDSMEVLNENEGWGYYESDLPHEFSTGASLHSVRQDWFNLLNHGHRYAAVGNSDSHHVTRALAGYPRNYTPSTTDDPGAIEAQQVADAIRNKHLFTTVGPYVDFSVNGQPMGSDVQAVDLRVELHIRIQAASWIDCDRVEIVVNGDVVETLTVPDTRNVVRLDTKHHLRVLPDSWITLLVEGDDPLGPIVPASSRPILPIALTNPVWVDADADGRWTPPSERAGRLLDAVLAGDTAFDQLSPAMRGLVLQESRSLSGPAALPLVRAALADPERRVRLAAARAAEHAAAPALAAAVDDAYATAADDPYLCISLLRATGACTPERLEPRVFAFIDEHGEDVVRRYSRELVPLLGGRFVDEWLVAGYFPSPSQETLVSVEYGPEKASGEIATFRGKEDAEVGWTPMKASDGGYLDLRAIDKRKQMYSNAIAYAQVYLYAPDDRTVRYALGTDDGCQMYANDHLVYEDNTRHGASPLGHFGKLGLHAGWNRVVLKVENGGGGFGLYFQVFDRELRWSRTPDAVP